MLRRLAPLALLALSSPAFAVGLGTTAFMGTDFGIPVTVNVGGPITVGNLGGSWLPSFDIYPTDDIGIQIHALDTLSYALSSNQVVYLGADVFFTVARVDAFKGTTGVIQPGGSLDLYSFSNDTYIALGGITRFGFEGGSAMRAGVYVVPGVGFETGNGDTNMVWSGSLQFSLWFGSGSGGSSGSKNQP